MWNYEGEKLFMDIDEPIRFRVLREVFTDKTPTASMAANAGRRQSAANLTAVNDLQANSAKIPPYSLTVSVEATTLTFCAVVHSNVNEFLVYYTGRWSGFAVLVGQLSVNNRILCKSSKKETMLIMLIILCLSCFSSN